MQKDLLTSKTTWGLLIMILTPFLAKYGLTAGDVTEIVNIAGQAIGGVLAFYGRLKAKDAIGSVAGIPIKKVG